MINTDWKPKPRNILIIYYSFLFFMHFILNVRGQSNMLVRFILNCGYTGYSSPIADISAAISVRIVDVFAIRRSLQRVIRNSKFLLQAGFIRYNCLHKRPKKKHILFYFLIISFRVLKTTVIVRVVPRHCRPQKKKLGVFWSVD